MADTPSICPHCGKRVNAVQCSFCGKPNSDTVRLVSSDTFPTVFICNVCVPAAVEVFDEWSRRSLPPGEREYLSWSAGQ
jgi:hypothetical protein